MLAYYPNARIPDGTHIHKNVTNVEYAMIADNCEQIRCLEGEIVILLNTSQGGY